MLPLAALNDSPDFAHALDGIFEHAPWVAERAAGGRPFATLADLHAALMRAVLNADAGEQTAFLCNHPDLAPGKLPTGLTDASAAEQTGLAMAHTPAAADLEALTRAYRECFGFPFIIAVARHTAENVLRQLRQRLGRGAEQERAAALAEIGHITLLRLLARVDGPGAPPVAGHLSTHVLDVAAGAPAARLAVTLLQEGRPVAESATDDDGRAAGLLLPGPLRQGQYELRFAAGAYFAPRDSFYDVIPIPFRITDSAARYHIPLLLAPFGYSTYRGS